MSWRASPDGDRMPGRRHRRINGGDRVKKALKPIKKLFKQAKANPLIAIAVTVVAVLLVGGLIVFAAVGGGGGDDDDAVGVGGTKTEKAGKGKKDPAIEKARKHKVKPAPVRSSPGTLDVARSIGTYAVAQGRGRVKRPSSIAVRVSAAPKQKVTVNYQLACYRENGGTKIGTGSYTPRPPDIRNLPLPISGANECVITVGAQLTSHRPGRVKVAIIAG
jgi:hypothetical protein